MASVALPPDHLEAARLLARAGHAAKVIVRVYGVGDPEAEVFEGKPLETILFVTPSGEGRTALCLEGKVWVYHGWGEADQAEFCQ